MSLRNFRFEKKPQLNGVVTQQLQPQQQQQQHQDAPMIKQTSPVVVQKVQSADAPESPASLTPKEKEIRLVQTRQENPDYDIMAIQDALISTQWDVEKASAYLKQHCRAKNRYTVTVVKKVNNVTSQLPPSVLPQQVQGQTTPGGQFKRIVKQDSDKDTDESDFDSRNNGQVFDSDDDTDEAEYMNQDRKAVFEFLNNAKYSDLVLIKSLTKKKAEIILEQRPYTSWADLITRFQEQKHLSTEVLNNTQEYIDRRNSLTAIMKKCNRIVKKIGKAIEQGGEDLLKQPQSLSSELKLAEYQLIGLNWLSLLHKHSVNGILADEMGLGKTIQIISFLAYLKETKQAKRTHLIVVPSSTLNNWQQELERWCPELTVMKYHGDQDSRRHLRIKISKESLNDYDIMLTTYNMVGASAEEKKMFRVVKFHYVVFDEAHMLKNMTSQRYQMLVRILADRRILLTGTPLQNNLLELMSLLCFVMPDMIGAKAEDIKALFTNRAKAKTEGGGEGGPDDIETSQIEQAKSIMKPFVLRRLKRDVLSFLPPKTEEIIKVALTPGQLEKYHNLVAEFKSEKNIEQAEKNVSGMTILMDMRKLANHPLLLRYHFTDAKVKQMARALAKDSSYKGTNANQIFQDIAYLSDFKLYQMAEKHHSLINLVRIPDSVVLDCGKFRILDTLLPKLKSEGHRVLIFSQFVMMLDVIEKYLEIKGFGFLRLDGSTAVEDRQDMINLYNNDDNIFIFLLSTRAGGLGINLTTADTVIVYDIDFNPYNDKQAEDRCHRIGQTKPVSIYKLIAENTIEEGMLAIAKDKLKLEREVTSEEVEAKEEHKCVVRLLTTALGIDENRVEHLVASKPAVKRVKTDDDPLD